jgi:hypothetical protein
MFIAGKTYKIKVDEGEGIVEYFNCKVVRIDGAVVKFHNGRTEKIVNTASLRFISAEPQD